VSVTVKAVAPDAEKLAAVIALAAAGTIRADVGRTVPVERFHEAVDAAEGPHARGKTVLTFGD
jgi:NADPH:quinone reductase-like Zn-dependent oxidoreductase